MSVRAELTEPASLDPQRVMFLYWGRRGGVSRLALEIGRAAMAEPLLCPTVSVSRQNERFDSFLEFGSALFPVTTFQKNLGAMTDLWRVPALRHALARRLRADGTTSAITLIPHVWSPLVNPVFRRAGVRNLTIVHDADAHPGDRTGLVQRWIHRDMGQADRLVTLSAAVTERLIEAHGVPRSKILTLFHPTFDAAHAEPRRPPPPGTPFRLLFLGRIYKYKGLGLLIDAMEHLRAQGVSVALSVCGEGDIGVYESRLQSLGVQVLNRWLSDEEINDILGHHDALALSHLEASQSGVAALAGGFGLPTIATPVGGLVEQVRDGETGVLAERADSTAFAAAVRRLIEDPALYCRISVAILAKRSRLSASALVRALALDLRQQPA